MRAEPGTPGEANAMPLLCASRFRSAEPVGSNALPHLPEPILQPAPFSGTAEREKKPEPGGAAHPNAEHFTSFS